jgi:hypothetical protein
MGYTPRLVLEEKEKHKETESKTIERKCAAVGGILPSDRIRK